MTVAPTSTKAAWRSRLRAERRARRPTEPPAEPPAGPPDDGSAADRLAELVLSLPEVRRAERVAGYVSRAGEPDTTALLRRWADAGTPQVLLPVLLDDDDLDWAPAGPHLTRSARRPGLREPSTPRLGRAAIHAVDVAVVPALAVDQRGHRLGQGGGSYDRALARLRPGTLVVALLHPHELVTDELPNDPHDRPVQVVVSTAGITRLSPPG